MFEFTFPSASGTRLLLALVAPFRAVIRADASNTVSLFAGVGSGAGVEVPPGQERMVYVPSALHVTGLGSGRVTMVGYAETTETELGLPADDKMWVTVPTSDIVGGFTTQAANPLRYGVVEVNGARYLAFRGSLVVPGVRPATDTTAVQNLPAVAHYHLLYMNSAAASGWNVVGRRSRFGAPGTTLLWLAAGTDVANEVIDMGATAAVRLP